MLRYSRYFIITGIVLFALVSCNSIPDHAHYIPKDATMVLGINLRSLGKKIAWELLTGSKIFKSIEKKVPSSPDKKNNDALSGLDKSGIDVFNTFYIYLKTDKRYVTGNKIIGLVPLADAAKWDEYVKKAFPKAEIKEHNGRKETGFGSIYMGWNKSLLIITNVIGNPEDYMSMLKDNNAGSVQSTTETAALSAELDRAFNITKENSLLENKKFDSLEKAGHDIAIWLNYEAVMNDYGNQNMAQMTGGVSVSGNIWKDAALAMGFDFEKGKITGDMEYFIPEKLKGIGVEFGATNADKDMILRMPKDNMDIMIATHSSPKALRSMIDTMGMTGLANSTLTGQGLDLDGILDAFTGDIAFDMNALEVRGNKKNEFTGDAGPKISFNMNFAIKINKKENFNKLYELGKSVLGAGTIFEPIGENGIAIPLNNGAKDTIYYMMNDQYAILSNKYQNVTGFLNGTFTNKQPDENISSKIIGYPWTMYFDVQQLCKNIDPSAISNSSSDSLKIEECKKLLKSISFYGGAYKNNAMAYHMDISFMDTVGNSLLTLMDLTMKMQDADKSEETKANF